MAYNYWLLSDDCWLLWDIVAYYLGYLAFQVGLMGLVMAGYGEYFLDLLNRLII